mmetsp:Transcript_12781/g.12799  ORF Transcript_12781/g.12799 Transcript_12781/m.12799 type:complete len:90 (-) Transcript_12781:259-528(-)|eukprot:CAMPEP_0196994904 /NCGR_PEP_ID=MMETSP1380-20130617/1119_1 /TAXON_ID=5936 /ORGANISM="Euplotes crassus, Strain CT5" /LENGTH=89 /DNA_ID=CAMNT_0042410403 /DNA_START=339 /DNA_END=608 /DNA_ORIENTATION=+
MVRIIALQRFKKPFTGEGDQGNKCKAMFMPNIQIQGEEIKEEPDYESEDDHSEDEYEQDEEEDEADSPGYDYLEPIMEMQSSEERGSYS